MNGLFDDIEPDLTKRLEPWVLNLSPTMQKASCGKAWTVSMNRSGDIVSMQVSDVVTIREARSLVAALSSFGLGVDENGRGR